MYKFRGFSNNKYIQGNSNANDFWDFELYVESFFQRKFSVRLNPLMMTLAEELEYKNEEIFHDQKTI